MSLWNQETACLTAGELRFAPEESQQALVDMLLSLCSEKPKCDLSGDSLLLPFPPQRVRGGTLGVIAETARGALHAVTLWVEGVRSGPPTAAKQRALLFSAMSLRDPCPDTQRPVAVTLCRGATAYFATDPRLGAATLRIVYAEKQPC